MQYQTSICFIATITVILGSSNLSAQPLSVPLNSKSSVEELAAAIMSEDESKSPDACYYLSVKHKEGIDISAAASALRVFVSRNVNLKKSMTGVNVDPNSVFALRYLMEIGDAQAIEHFLLAQKRYTDYQIQTGAGGFATTVASSGNLAYLEMIDPAHYEQAYKLYSLQYKLYKQRVSSLGQLNNNGPQALHFLARFAPDPEPVIKELNFYYGIYQKNSEIIVWKEFLEAVIILADQPELIPDFVNDTSRLTSRHIVAGNDKLTGMVAALAPFRAEAFELLTKYLQDDELRSQWHFCLLIYIDSASRLPVSERIAAYEKLASIGQKAYRGSRTLSAYYPSGSYRKPRFVESTELLKLELLKAFGEEQLADPESFKESLDIGSGLGTSF